VLLVLVVVCAALIIGALPILFGGKDARKDPADMIGQMKKPLANPKVVINKGERRLYLYDGFEVVRAYDIGLGPNPVGPKLRAGDGRTPEGQYHVCVKNPNSRYYLSLGISYPNVEDARRGLAEGLITREVYKEIAEAINRGAAPPWDTRLGGEIFIHGRGSQSDWTQGCIALNDKDMRELYDWVSVGTPVTIEAGTAIRPGTVHANVDCAFKGVFSGVGR
jgi:murein L,D-transpeptidase YafK